jgi:hypothetical protein
MEKHHQLIKVPIADEEKCQPSDYEKMLIAN